MKNTLIIAFLILISNIIYSQSTNTFCYGSISVSLISGGKAIMIRKDNMQKIISKIEGDFNLYGKGGSTELLKINFSGNEYRYDLIRDGNGTPSVLIDFQGRRYTICNSIGSDNEEIDDSFNNISKGDFRSKYIYNDPTIEVEKNFRVIGEIAISSLGFVSWFDAKTVCDNLKNGWHFPSEVELKEIYSNNLNSNKIKFQDRLYWSSNTVKIKEGEGSFARYNEGAYAFNLVTGFGKIEGFSFEIGGNNKIIENQLIVIKKLSIDEVNNYKKTGTLIMPQSYQDSVLIAKKSKDSIELENKLGTLYKIGSLEYSFYSIKKSVNLDELRGIIRNEFPEWRLPTIDELRSIYKELNQMTNRPKIRNRYSGQQTDVFWSSTRNNNNGQFYTLDLISNYEYQYNQDELFEACIVREKKESYLDKKEINKVISNLEIAKNDFSLQMNWKDANNACAELGNGWRLPTKVELNLLYQNRYIIGGFSGDNNYWSSTENGSNNAYSLFFVDGYEGNSNKLARYYVRAVRTK